MMVWIWMEDPEDLALRRGGTDSEKLGGPRDFLRPVDFKNN
jgi:hypothetical protein